MDDTVAEASEYEMVTVVLNSVFSQYVSSSVTIMSASPSVAVRPSYPDSTVDISEVLYSGAFSPSFRSGVSGDGCSSC